MRLASVVLITIACAAALGGCGESSGTDTVTVTTGSTATVTVTTTTTTTTAEPTPVTWPPAGLGPDQTPVLRTPSGNIECVLLDDLGVVCQAKQHSWTLPPKPASCEFEWTDGIFLGPTGGPQFRCASDAPFGPDEQYWPRTTVPYQSRVSVDGVTCVSRTAGLTCTNTGGRGFTLSRQQREFF